MKHTRTFHPWYIFRWSEVKEVQLSTVYQLLFSIVEWSVQVLFSPKQLPLSMNETSYEKMYS